MGYRCDAWDEDHEATDCRECGVHITFEDYMEHGLCHECKAEQDEKDEEWINA